VQIRKSINRHIQCTKIIDYRTPRLRGTNRYHCTKIYKNNKNIKNNKNNKNTNKNNINCKLDDQHILGSKECIDTVNHEILLHILYNYGIRGVAHDWLKFVE